MLLPDVFSPFSCKGSFFLFSIVCTPPQRNLSRSVRQRLEKRPFQWQPQTWNKKIYAFKIYFNPSLSLSPTLALYIFISPSLHRSRFLSHGPLSRNYEIFSSSFPWVYDWSLVVARVNVELLLSEGGWDHVRPLVRVLQGLTQVGCVAIVVQ